MRKNFVLAAVLLNLAACTDVAPPNTASGRPEVTIAAAKTDVVKSLLISDMINRGFKLEKDTAYDLTFSKLSENLAANVLMSTQFGGLPMARVSYTITELNGSVRVVASESLVQNAGTGFEHSNDMTGGADGPKLQAFLDKVEAEASARTQPSVLKEVGKKSRVASR